MAKQPSRKSLYAILGIIVLIIIFALYNNSTQKPKPVYETAAASVKTITQEVSVTGSVTPTEKIDLAFEKGGKISEVSASVGDKVIKGQALVALNNSDIKAQLAQGIAALEAQQAQLNQLKRGTRPEQIQISTTKVASAQKAADDAQANLDNVKQKADVDLANIYDKVKDVIADSYNKADAAVNTTIADLFSNTGGNPALTFAVNDPQIKIKCEAERLEAGNAVLTIKAQVAGLPTSQSGLDKSLRDANSQLAIIQNFLKTLTSAVNSSTGLSSTTLDTYKTDVNTASSSITTAVTNINNQEQSIAAQIALNKSNITTAQTSLNAANNALLAAQDQLALDQAGSTPEQIAAQAAQVKSAQANVQNIQSQLEKTTLTSPINGIVTKQDAKVGEIVAMNAPLVSLISEANFQIEANVTEADIAKVKIDDSATVTLDAYGNDIVFEAKVIAIDPAETVIQGVATYKVTLEFTKEDDQIKSGMTANIDILTAKKENAIAIPQRAVITKDSQKYVLIDTGAANPEERRIETGIRGSDGNIEVTSGLSGEERVIISGVKQ